MLNFWFNFANIQKKYAKSGVQILEQPLSQSNLFIVVVSLCFLA
jgi:hypothetical protein